MYSSRNRPRSSYVTSRGVRPAARLGGLGKDPWVAEDASANEDAGHPTAQPGHDGFRVDAIAAAEHGNAQLTGNPRNQIPVRPTRVALRGRPTVNGHRRGAGILHHLRHKRCVSLFVVPTRPHLDRHGNLDGFGHCRNHRCRLGRFSHQAATGLVLGNLRDGAAHVDVDDIGPHALEICAAAAIFSGSPPKI